MNNHSAAPPDTGKEEELEGLEDLTAASLGDFPMDDIMIRKDRRMVYEVIARIDDERFVMNPDLQRDFIWSEVKQSKFIESVIMRIPLPAFYLAEDKLGRLVVVDGLQRLSTFHRFVKDQLKLDLPARAELHGKKFSDIAPGLKGRVERCDLILYIIETKMPERVRLDIFERVNGSVPLSRQQMRNCLYMGGATNLLKDESQTDIFHKATGYTLQTQLMRDREFVNRFCAFQLLGPDEYRGDMDDFLAKVLLKMNKMEQNELSALTAEFRRGLENNFILHGDHAFRKTHPGQTRRGVLNVSFWDVMSTGLSHYTKEMVEQSAEELRQQISILLENAEFDDAITIGTNAVRKVRSRFHMAHDVIKKVLGTGGVKC